MKTTGGPEDAKDLLKMKAPSETKKEEKKKVEMMKCKTERVLRYSDSNNMKLSLAQPYDFKGESVIKTMTDPKDILNTRFDPSAYAKPPTKHELCHKKGNIAMRNGKAFYLK